MPARRAFLPWLLLALLPVLAHLPALTPWFRFDPLYVVSGLTPGTWQTNGWLAGYPGWIDGNAGVTTEALGRFAARAWLAGRVPWWNPYSGVGLPLAAEGQTTALFLPFGLLLALPHGLLLLRIALSALAGLFTQALLRRLGMGVPAALLGAVLFELNGTFAWFAHGPIMPVAFLPLLLLGVEQARGGGVPVAAVLGTAWSFLAGFPETAALDLLFAGVWAALRLAQAPARASYAARIGGAVAIGLLLAAPAIWPFVEALPREFLGGHAGPTGGGWQRGNLALMLFPYSGGNLMADLARGPSTGWVWFRTGGYVDLVVAALALAALRRRAPDRALRMVLAVWIAATGLRAAGWGPAVALFDMVPLLRQAMVHLYMMPSWSMAAAVLAAFTVRDWQAGRHAAWIVPVVVLTPMGVVGLIWSAGSIASAPTAMAVQAIGTPLLVTAAAFWLLRGPATGGRQRALVALVGAYATASFMLPLFAGTHGRRLDVPAIQYLQSHLGLGRVVSFGPLVPNYGAMFGIAEIDHNYLPVPRVWVDTIRARLQPGSDGINFYDGRLPPPAMLQRVLPGYRDMGAAYALTWPTESLPTGPGGAALVYHDAIMNIFALPDPAPYLEAPGCLLAGGRDMVEADCPLPAHLVRRELVWPGWRATLNGVAVTLESNGIFQSVTLPPGHSAVVFRYAPPGIGWAFAMCAAGAVALLAAAAGPGLLRRRSRWLHRRGLAAQPRGAI
jgi:hypothetical protein